MEKLQGLVQHDEKFSKSFKFWSGYKRSRWITRAEDLLYAGCAYPDAVEVLKTLGELELGTFKRGRRGGKTRLEWNRHPGRTAKIVLGEMAGELPPSIYADDEDENMTDDGVDVAPGNEDAFIDDYNLRMDFKVQTRLPVDLTRDEANRLADHIRTIHGLKAAKKAS